MNNNLLQYQFNDNNIRIIMRDGEPWWVAKDVADILGYSQTQAMLKRLDEDEFISSKLDGMNMDSILINESGLYNAIIGSKKPEAKKFKKWITSEVLPQIRKTGNYIDPQSITKIDLCKMIIESEEQRIRAEEKLFIANHTIEAQKPAVETYNAYLTATNTYNLTESAKQIGISPKIFMEWLKSCKILYRNDTQAVQEPYLKNGWFAQKTYTQTLDDGARMRKQARITAKGLAGLRELAVKHNLIQTRVVSGSLDIFDDVPVENIIIDLTNN